MKKIYFLLLFIPFYSFSQKKEIRLAPNSLKGYSSVIFENFNSGSYVLKIINNNKTEVLSKKIDITSTIRGTKINFNAFKRGRYTFVLTQENKPVFSFQKTKL